MQEALEQQATDHEVALRRVGAEKLQAFSLLEAQRAQWAAEHKRVEELEVMLAEEISRVATLEGGAKAEAREHLRKMEELEGKLEKELEEELDEALRMHSQKEAALQAELDEAHLLLRKVSLIPALSPTRPRTTPQSPTRLPQPQPEAYSCTNSTTPPLGPSHLVLHTWSFARTRARARRWRRRRRRRRRYSSS